MSTNLFQETNLRRKSVYISTSITNATIWKMVLVSGNISKTSKWVCSMAKKALLRRRKKRKKNRQNGLHSLTMNILYLMKTVLPVLPSMQQPTRRQRLLGNKSKHNSMIWIRRNYIM